MKGNKVQRESRRRCFSRAAIHLVEKCAQVERDDRSSHARVGYFFFATLLGAEAFEVGVLNKSVPGDGNFLGCLGFFASRLLRS
ncbi:hypothetical protein [Paraburkholderia rhynchosiae]|uniref:hypothetical protein n=1 Tax=Paraburkholderia rhynchosiae TaxID=487049 RepID=UPI001304A29E|nr:hypothetical protein [Paraburkholderia rhynchosiae]